MRPAFSDGLVSTEASFGNKAYSLGLGLTDDSAFGIETLDKSTIRARINND